MLYLLPALYLAIMLFAYFYADRLLFQPPAPSYDPLEEGFFIEREGAPPLYAVFRKNPDAAYTVLYSHGNAEDLGHIQPVLQAFCEHDFNILAYDYSGYGQSGGSPSEKQACEDIRTAYRFLTQDCDTPEHNIILYGRSVGGGPAIDLAAEKPDVGGVILENTFVSAIRVRTRVPVFPVDRFRNLRKMRSIQRPVLVMHSTDDGLIPLWHGKKLFQATPTPKKKFWVQKAHHNDLMETAGQSYWEQLQAFEQMVKNH